MQIGIHVHEKDQKKYVDLIHPAAPAQGGPVAT